MICWSVYVNKPGYESRVNNVTQYIRNLNMTMNKKTSIALAASAAMTAGLAFSPIAAADSNPFQSTELSSGYMQLAKHHEEGKCGEAKCGEDTKKDAEGKCGEAKCGEDSKKDAEGKCGEAKCGNK